MENWKETTIEERKLVIKLSNEGKSQLNIAKVVGRSVNCIQKILQKFKKTGMLANNEGRGRKKIMNSITERRVIHQVKIDPKISAPKIAASTSNTLGRSVSAETVRRVLRKAGYNGRLARKKPLIGKRNRVKRLKFAKEHILKPLQFWNEVIFSDESKFNIFGSDGRRMVSRKPNTSHHPKHTIPTVKHGVSRLKCYRSSVWSHLERAVQKHQITSKEQLKSVLQEEWLNIAPETTRHVMESMPRRLEAVISTKGYATKY
ncbi:transposable element Tc1 transposase [Trichonephila clavipes]|nr:transposable element Tc1 transposase [Trichonephila clavipes]